MRPKKWRGAWKDQTGRPVGGGAAGERKDLWFAARSSKHAKKGKDTGGGQKEAANY